MSSKSLLARLALKPKGKAAASAAMMDLDSDAGSDFEQENAAPVAAVEPAAAATKKQPKIQKKTQLEHILLRPDTYIGSVEAEVEPYWVAATTEAGASPRMEYRKVSIVPGLFKIFDEILVNAADNKQRDEKGVAVMTRLEVTIDRDAGSIRIKNDGKGISVAAHEEYPMHIPQLIFGELLTSSNYDDDVKQTVGGRNGFGAKLANIFSTRFVVDIDDSTLGQSYHQEWSGHMSTVQKPVLRSYSGSKNSTAITFWPDLQKFGMSAFDDDLVALLRKRVFDIAGTTPDSLRVFLDGEELKAVRNFKNYLELYLGASGDEASPRAYAAIDHRWEVCVALSPHAQFAQVSFVNNIATARGGTHVNYITDLVTKALLELISKQKGVSKSAKELSATDLKRHLFLFVNALVVNPTFDSQTKTNLTTKRSDLEQCIDPDSKKLSKVKLESLEKWTAFVAAIKKSGLVQAVIDRATEKAEKKLAKTDGKKMVQRITGIPKLEDANLAGTKDGHLCTLILTEGDSAKALAVSGLAVVGRDRFGVFPLKGKLLNVREASASQLMANGELTALKQILGLQAGKKYTSTRELRYGRVMIMADQDHDGSHIKGLVINLFAHCWPSLLTLRDPSTGSFLWEFITPIVRVSKGYSDSGAALSKNAKEVLFYSLPDYEAWCSANAVGTVSASNPSGGTKGWHIKYYKGLGTSTSAEAKAYFGELARHMIEFAWDDSAKDKLELAFSAKQADQRKEWLARYDPARGSIDQSGYGQVIPYSTFVDRELILFSLASNQRAIPSLVDGLKPGQRKILYCAFKRNLKREVKVAQLAGYVSEHSAYHHGEASLCSTIIGMAQNFVGNNNINLLLPNGQFGTRLQGGKDAASPRYVFTTLSPVTRAIFPSADDALLSYCNDDGQVVEPEWYVPVVPLVLVNGSAGIGTGWSSDVPNYSPRDIVQQLKRMIAIHRDLVGDADWTPEMLAAAASSSTSMDGRLEAAFVGALPELTPFYKGFRGVIKVKSIDARSRAPDRFTVKGVLERVGPLSLHISELPLHCWTGDYKATLEAMLAAGEIREFREYHTDTQVSFLVELTEEQMAAASAEGAPGMYKRFKLNSSLSTGNMVLFGRDGKLKRYGSANDILRDFFAIRLEYYHRRKAALLRAHKEDNDRLSNKVRFIRAVCGLSGADEKITVTNRAKKDIVAQLDQKRYLRIPKKKDTAKKSDSEEDAADAANVEEEEEAAAGSGRASDFDYLMSMDLWALSKEKAAALTEELLASEAALKVLQATSASSMWETDLARFMEALEAHEADERRIDEDAAEKLRLKRLGMSSSAAKGAKAQALLKASIIRGEVIEDTTDDFDESKVKVKVGRKKKADLALAAAAGGAVDIEALMAVDDDEDDEAGSSSPRDLVAAAAKLAIAATVSRKPKKLASTATTAAAKKAPAAKKGKKKAFSDSEDDEDDDDISMDDDSASDCDAPVAPRAVRPGRAAAAKKTSYVDASEDEEDEDEEDVSEVDEEDDSEVEEVKPKKKKAAAVAPAPAPKAAAVPTKAKKKRAAASSDEEDDDNGSDFAEEDDDESDFELSGKKKKAAVAVKQPAAKKEKAPALVKKEKEPKEVKAPKITAAAAKKAAAAAAVAPAPAPVASLVQDLSHLSLAERMAARLAASSASIASVSPLSSLSAALSAAAPSTPPKPKAAKRAKEPKAAIALADPASPLEASPTPDPKRRKLYNAADKQGRALMELVPPTPAQMPGKTKAAKPAAAKAKAAAPKKAKKKAASESEEEDEDDEEDEADYAPAPIKAPAKKATATAAAAAAAAAAASSRPQRARAPTKSYTEKSDDDDEAEESEEEDVSVEELSDDDYED